MSLGKHDNPWARIPFGVHALQTVHYDLCVFSRFNSFPFRLHVRRAPNPDFHSRIASSTERHTQECVGLAGPGINCLSPPPPAAALKCNIMPNVIPGKVHGQGYDRGLGESIAVGGNAS
ncbi:hypothetical protein WAI453_008617 [Rhynchosporium graminicola]